MPQKRPSLFLVDGSNNVYRSYFAIRGLTNSAGLATNAVYGFTTTLKKLLKDHDPDYIAVAFDIGSAKTRHEAFADYKKDRRPMPDIVRWSFMGFSLALAAVGVALIVGVPGVLPWGALPQSSPLIGWIFLGLRGMCCRRWIESSGSRRLWGTRSCLSCCTIIFRRRWCTNANC